MGDRATVALTVSDVQGLFSIPLLVQYNPAVIQVEDVRNGGFLSGGNQVIHCPARGPGEGSSHLFRYPPAEYFGREWKRDTRRPCDSSYRARDFSDSDSPNQCARFSTEADSDGFARSVHSGALSLETIHSDCRTASHRQNATLYRLGTLEKGHHMQRHTIAHPVP